MSQIKGQRRVVVTGLGLVSPVGNTVGDAWENLLAGKCGVAEIKQFDASAFPTRIAAEVKNFVPTYPNAQKLKKTLYHYTCLRNVGDWQGENQIRIKIKNG